MTKADRRLRKHMKQREEQETSEQAETERREQIEDYNYLNEILAEIQTVFRLLIEQDYPFTEGVRVPRKLPFSVKTRYVLKAGWQIGAYDRVIGGDTFVEPFYLLSDGRLYGGDRVCSPREWFAGIRFSYKDAVSGKLSFEMLHALRHLLGPSEELKNI